MADRDRFGFEVRTFAAATAWLVRPPATRPRRVNQNLTSAGPGAGAQVHGEIAQLHAQFLPLSERWAQLTQRGRSSHTEAHPEIHLHLTSNNMEGHSARVLSAVPVGL